MKMRVIRSCVVLCAGVFCSFMAVGCSSDEPVGHSKTTVKHTEETPTQKRTVTETKEKDTKLYPK